MEKLMSLFDGFDIEKIGALLPSADSLMKGLDGWMVLLVLAGPLLMLGFGIYYLFFAPKEANHSVGYRFFYAMSQVHVWQYTQRLAGIAYTGLGGILLLIIGLISFRFGFLTPPDMVWLAAKCLLWEVILVVIVTLAVDIIIILLFDSKGNPRKPGEKPLNLRLRSKPASRARSRTAASTGGTRRPRTGSAAQRPQRNTSAAQPQRRSTTQRPRAETPGSQKK